MAFLCLNPRLSMRSSDPGASRSFVRRGSSPKAGVRSREIEPEGPSSGSPDSRPRTPDWSLRRSWLIVVLVFVLVSPMVAFAQYRAGGDHRVLDVEQGESDSLDDGFAGPRVKSVLQTKRRAALPTRFTRASEVPPPQLPSSDMDASRIPDVPTSVRGRLLALPPASGSPGKAFPVAPPSLRHVVDPVVSRVFPSLTTATYVGDARCLSCHEDKKDDWRRSVYGLIHYARSLPSARRGCEGCHGPGSEHLVSGAVDWIVNPSKVDHRSQGRICLSCHAEERLVRRKGWSFSGHRESQTTCLDCHVIHRPRYERALVDEPNRLCYRCHRDQETYFSMTSHHPVKSERVDGLRSRPDGKIRCLDCHEVHTANIPKNLKNDRSDRCLRCHAEYRGPFLFQHGGLDVLSDGCMTCHLPHGSPNRSLLARPDRVLCLTCHTDRATHNVTSTCFAAGCHSDIHGSNRNRWFNRNMSVTPEDIGISPLGTAMYGGR